jgi:hypothetical protein
MVHWAVGGAMALGFYPWLLNSLSSHFKIRKASFIFTRAPGYSSTRGLIHLLIHLKQPPFVLPDLPHSPKPHPTPCRSKDPRVRDTRCRHPTIWGTKVWSVYFLTHVALFVS